MEVHVNTKTNAAGPIYEDLTELFCRESAQGDGSRQWTTAGEIDSPIKGLKAAVLSLDWEITAGGLTAFRKEVVGLTELWQADKSLLVLLRILLVLGDYLGTRKSAAYPGTIQVLSTVYNSLEKIVLTADMTPARKNELVRDELQRYKTLLAEIKSWPGNKPEGNQPAPPVPAAQTVDSAALKLATTSGKAGAAAEISPALADLDMPAGEVQIKSEWSEYAPFEEAEDRLHDFFAEDPVLRTAPPPRPEIMIGSAGDDIQPPAAALFAESDLEQEIVARLAETRSPGRQTELPPQVAEVDAAGEALQMVRRLEDLPIYPLKKLVESVDTCLDKETLRELSRQINGCRESCRGNRTLDILLGLLNSTGYSLSLLGQNVSPYYINLLKAIYGKLEKLYLTPEPGDIHTWENLRDEIENFAALQNKIILSLATSLVKSKNNLRAAQQTARQLTEQLAGQKTAAEKKEAAGRKPAETATVPAAKPSRRPGLLARLGWLRKN